MTIVFTVRMTTLELTTLAERLRRARRGRRMSGKELAKRFDIAPETLSRYENGAPTPRLVLYAYCVETGMPMEWLETGTITADNSGEHSYHRWYDLPLFAVAV